MNIKHWTRVAMVVALCISGLQAAHAAENEKFNYRNLEIEKSPPLQVPPDEPVTFTPKGGAKVVAPAGSPTRTDIKVNARAISSADRSVAVPWGSASKGRNEKGIK